MPSLFPGMDPFLEHPAYFPDLHDSLVTNTREFIQAKLPPPYYCVIGSRVWVEPSQRPIGPDVRVEHSNGLSEDSSGGTALALATRTLPVVVSVFPEEQRETLVEIRSRHDDQERLVTVIEFLSPTNKTPNTPGREKYLDKQREILDSQTHLVEIDLIRKGEHALAVPFDTAWTKAGPYEYLACVHRFDRPYDYFLYPIRLPQKLPEIGIPLLPGDAEIGLDLQAVFTRCHDLGPYARWVKYDGKVPPPPLAPELAAWVRDVLQTKS